MKRHEATLARRCPTCCAPLGVVCYWPGRPTTQDVPHPLRLRKNAEDRHRDYMREHMRTKARAKEAAEVAAKRAEMRSQAGDVLAFRCRQCRAPAGVACHWPSERDERLSTQPHQRRVRDARDKNNAQSRSPKARKESA